MFTGLSFHTLDDKGRLAIPARFRDVLRGKGDERLFITTSDVCLVAYPADEWRSLTEKVSQLSLMEPEIQAFRRFYIGGASECPCDKQGRVLIPQPLRELAELDGQLLVQGMQRNFEIWNKDRWREARELAKVNFGALSSIMAAKGL